MAKMAPKFKLETFSFPVALISLEWLRSKELTLLLKSDAVQKINNLIVVELQ